MGYRPRKNVADKPITVELSFDRPQDLWYFYAGLADLKRLDAEHDHGNHTCGWWINDAMDALLERMDPEKATRERAPLSRARARERISCGVINGRTRGDDDETTKTFIRAACHPARMTDAQVDHLLDWSKAWQRRFDSVDWGSAEHDALREEYQKELKGNPFEYWSSGDWP